MLKRIPECSKHNCCSICKLTEEKSSGNWCFEWLRHLKDFEASQVLAAKHRQVHLMVDHTDNEVQHIRSRLAILQTQTPAWTIIDAINEQAKLKATRFAQNIHHELSKINSEREETSLELSEGEIGESNVDDDALKDMENLMKRRRLMKTMLEIKRRRCSKFLKTFVAFHICEMLERLYNKIADEEKTLKLILGITNEDLFGASTTVKKYSDGSMAEIHKKIEQDKRWYAALYSTTADISIVGPVGERPLHVCALSAYRFEHVDEKMFGNYFSEGILQGMMDYIKNIDKGGVKGWIEAATQYGKDYCAAAGSFLLKDTKGAHLLNESERLELPFWSQILKWKTAHLRNRLFECCGVVAPKRIAYNLVSTGIYEGETIIFPLIAGKNEDIIQDLFAKEAEWREDRGQQLIACPLLSRFLQAPVKGLFFHPMHRRILTSFSAYKGWSYYAHVRYRDINVESSSKRSYFGLNALSFAASQGNVAIFDLVFNEVECLLLLDQAVQSEMKLLLDDNDVIEESDRMNLKSCGKKKKQFLRKGLLDAQDRYGNTLLHVAARNDTTAIYDRLIQLGADNRINNRDGLTPFTLTARYGIWNSFNHIWNKHLTQTVWKFGNAQKKKSDHTIVDWKGIKTFLTRAEVESCINALLNIYVELCEKSGMNGLVKTLQNSTRVEENLKPAAYNILHYKHSIVEQKARNWREDDICKKVRFRIEKWLQGKSVTDNEEIDAPLNRDDAFDEHEEDAEQRSAIRMITLFRPAGWYKHTKHQIEEIILRKWSDGYHLVHLGQSLIPYCLLLIIFGLMWFKRELHVLEHNLWWATPEAIADISDIPGFPHDKILRNPIKADIPELLRLTQASLTGTELFQSRRTHPELFGDESTCGWRAIRDSTSGRLQAVQVTYGVLSLLRLAYTQRRFRPSDWDENEDLTITKDETINFVYLNLEVLLHVIMCGLYMTIGIARVAAGEDCVDYFVRIEKNSTAIAALFLFLNLIAVCKPYEGIGLLVLTTYKFLISDVFNFIIMYSTLFAGFLLALQTLHNSNRVYLAWLDSSTLIFPQVKAVTSGAAYLENSNPPAGPGHVERLQDTHTSMDGCADFKRPIWITAMTLLEISFGDGLSDALQQAHRADFQCAGFRPDPLIAYILVFWVFLTNVLILNMLIAMMNYTFDRQKKTVHSVWLLDVSYRIMRYERLFPELIDRMQAPRTRYSFWRRKFWAQFFLDVCLVIYCLPDINLWGYSHAAFVWAKQKFTKSSKNLSGHRTEYEEAVKSIVEKVAQKIDEETLKAENAARVRAGVKEVDLSMAQKIKKKSGCIGRTKETIKFIKGHATEKKLEFMSKLQDVILEVSAWSTVLGTGLLSESGPLVTGDENLISHVQSHMNENVDSSKLPFLQQAHPEICTYVMPQKLVLPLPIRSAADPSAASPSLCAPCQASHSSSLPNNEENRPILQDPTHNRDKQQGTTDESVCLNINEKLLKQWLLVISLICQLDMLQQDFNASCTVTKIQTIPQAGAHAAAAEARGTSNDDSDTSDKDG